MQHVECSYIHSVLQGLSNPYNCIFKLSESDFRTDIISCEQVQTLLHFQEYIDPMNLNGSAADESLAELKGLLEGDSLTATKGQNVTIGIAQHLALCPMPEQIVVNDCKLVGTDGAVCLG
jgi:hypothetical protein